jgi:hypothetical protein
MPATITRSFIIILALTLLVGALVLAQESDGDTAVARDQSAVPRVGLAAKSELEAEKLSPLMRRIRSLMIQEETRIAEIEARLESVQDPVAALELHREIARVKSQTEISILEAQAAEARSNGNTELAEEIQEAVRVMKSRRDARQLQRVEP